MQRILLIVLFVLFLFLLYNCQDKEFTIIDEIIHNINSKDTDKLYLLAESEDIFEMLTAVDLAGFKIQYSGLIGIADDTRIYSLVTQRDLNSIIAIQIDYTFHIRESVIRKVNHNIYYKFIKTPRRIVPEDILSFFSINFDQRFYYEDEYYRFFSDNFRSFIFNRDRSIRTETQNTIYDLYKTGIDSFSVFYSSSELGRITLRSHENSYTLDIQRIGSRWRILNIQKMTQ